MSNTMASSIKEKQLEKQGKFNKTITLKDIIAQLFQPWIAQAD